YTFRNLSVVNQARLLIGIPCSGTSLTVTGVTDLSGGGVISNNQPGVCLISYTTPEILTTELDAAITGSAYSMSLSVQGGVAPYNFAIVSGSLEPNLS